jgi:hypothetical protein
VAIAVQRTSFIYPTIDREFIGPRPVGCSTNLADEFIAGSAYRL